MDLKAWRAQRTEGKAFETPSGLDVKLKRATLFDLAMAGSIPTPLVGMVNSLSEGKEKLSVEKFHQFAEVGRLVAKAAIVEPADLDVKELSAMDIIAIFNWATDEAASLATFREEPEQPD